MKKETKKMFVVGLKKTKTRPALWIDVQDTQKFNEYMKNKVGKEIIFTTDKEFNQISKTVDLLLETISKTGALSIKDWTVLRNKLQKINK
jgi:hypothetical protein